MDELREPHPFLYLDLIRRALEEDLGRAGDLTSDSVVPAGKRASGRLLARRGGVVAGLEVARRTFQTLAPDLKWSPRRRDGDRVSPGEELALLEGPARAMLSAERTALNFLGRLSGIATATRDLVDSLQGHPARVVCTRKTTPGLRLLEKYAVRAGGGSNHRFGLDDAVLIKDNHRALAGGVTEAVRRVRRSVGHMVKVQIEVDTLEELEEALEVGVDAVLLDNMSPELLARAVERVRGKVLAEASGGITPETVLSVAEAGVDLISLGWLTHSAPALDVSLELS